MIVNETGLPMERQVARLVTTPARAYAAERPS